MSAAYGELLTRAKCTDIVNNFEATTSSLKSFQQTAMKTDQVSRRFRATETSQGRKPTSTVCYRCDGEGHAAAVCKYKDFECQVCHKKGHLKRACRNAKQEADPSYSSNQPRNVQGAPRSRDAIRCQGFSSQGAAFYPEGPEAGQQTLMSESVNRPPETHGHAATLPSSTQQSAAAVQPAIPQSAPAHGTEKEFGLLSVKGDCEYVRPYHVMVRCNGVKIKIEVDTGAALSLISEKLYRRRFKKWKLQPCDVRLSTYSAE